MGNPCKDIVHLQLYFVDYLKVINTLWKMIQAPKKQIVQKITNGIGISVNQVALELLIKTCKILFDQ